jgi:citrate synthase
VNQPPSIVDQASAAAARDWVSTEEATRLLGVKRETLYAYASRGLVTSAPAPGHSSRSRVYSRADIERLRARSQARAGHGPVAASALRWGDPVLETRIGSIGPSGPVYRGRVAVELAREGVSFEEVCTLLWEAPFRSDEDQGARHLGAPVAHLRALLRPRAAPFEGMLVAAGALAAAEQHAEASLDVARMRAPTLLRRLVAASGLRNGGAAVTASLEAKNTARALLLALGGRTTAASMAALDEALILSADHELNPSTFAARVAASAGASLPACMMAALGSLSGSRHGGATARVEAFLAEVARPERGAAAIGARLARGDSVPGFGHPFYPDGDPRGARLLEVAQRIGGKTLALRTVTSVVEAMALVARERPTLDIGLVALAAALRLPVGAALAIFACGRLAGWIAHAIEQRSQRFVLRPRARYIGP